MKKELTEFYKRYPKFIKGISICLIIELAILIFGYFWVGGAYYQKIHVRNWILINSIGFAIIWLCFVWKWHRDNRILTDRLPLYQNKLIEVFDICVEYDQIRIMMKSIDLELETVPTPQEFIDAVCLKFIGCKAPLPNGSATYNCRFRQHVTENKQDFIKFLADCAFDEIIKDDEKQIT